MTFNTPNSRGSSALSPKHQVLAECLAMIGRPLRRTTVVALPLAAALAVALRNDVDTTMLGLWIGLVVGATVILGYVAGFAPQLDTIEAIENRRNEVVSIVGLFGAAWGSSALIVYPATQTSLRVLLGATLLAVMSAVGLGTLLLRPAFFVLAFSATVPLFVRLGTSGESAQFATAAVIAMCAVSLILHFVESNASSVTLIRNRCENALLGNRVQRLKERVLATEEELELAYQQIDKQQMGIGGSVTPVERAAVLTRSRFNSRLGDAWATAEDGGDSFSVGLVEIADYLSMVAQYGEDVAKRLFEELGKFIGSCLRTEDCVSGFTPPRFGLLLSDSDQESGSRAMERIRRRVESSPIDAGQPIICQLSMGVASYQRGVSPMEMITRSEQALAEAWGSGQNLLAWELLGAPSTPQGFVAPATVARALDHAVLRGPAKLTLSGKAPQETQATLPPH